MTINEARQKMPNLTYQLNDEEVNLLIISLKQKAEMIYEIQQQHKNIDK